MPDPVKSPAAVVREQADLRLLKGEVRGLNRRVQEILDRADRDVLAEYHELGKRLKAIKDSDAVKHGEWLPLLEELGIPTQRASEAMTVATLWWRFGTEAKGLKDFLRLAAGFKGKPTQQTITPGDETKLPPGGNLPGPSAGPVESGDAAASPGPADVGDACEELPPGAIVDPDGNILPPSVQDALEASPGAEKVLEHLRAAKKEARAFAETPAGAYVDARFIGNRIAAAALQFNNRVLTPKNTFRCDGHKGHGCTGNESCAKCKGKGYIPKPLKGDIGPKPKPKYHGRRR